MNKFITILYKDLYLFIHLGHIYPEVHLHRDRRSEINLSKSHDSFNKYLYLLY